MREDRTPKIGDHCLGTEGARKGNSVALNATCGGLNIPILVPSWSCNICIVSIIR